MTLSPVDVVLPDLRASSPELQSEQSADHMAWVREALSYLLRQQGLEVPPYPVTVAREEDRATKIVTEELILPLGNTVEQVVGESLQLPVVLDGETKLNPVEHFVEQDVGVSLQAPVVSNGETTKTFAGHEISRDFDISLRETDEFVVSKDSGESHTSEIPLATQNLRYTRIHIQRSYHKARKKTSTRMERESYLHKITSEIELIGSAKASEKVGGDTNGNRAPALGQAYRVWERGRLQVAKCLLGDIGWENGTLLLGHGIRYMGFGFQLQDLLNPRANDARVLMESVKGLMYGNIVSGTEKQETPSLAEMGEREKLSPFQLRSNHVALHVWSRDGTAEICSTHLSHRVWEPGGLAKLNPWDWPEKYHIHGEMLELTLKLQKACLQRTSEMLIKPAKETQNGKQRGNTYSELMRLSSQKVRLTFQSLEEVDFDWLVHSWSILVCSRSVVKGRVNTCLKLPIGSGQANGLRNTCPRLACLVADGETGIEGLLKRITCEKFCRWYVEVTSHYLCPTGISEKENQAIESRNNLVKYEVSAAPLQISNILLLHLEGKVCFSGGSNGIGRIWDSETVNKKLENVKDDFKKVKASFSGDDKVTLALSMETKRLEVGVQDINVGCFEVGVCKHQRETTRTRKNWENGSRLAFLKRKKATCDMIRLPYNYTEFVEAYTKEKRQR